MVCVGCGEAAARMPLRRCWRLRGRWGRRSAARDEGLRWPMTWPAVHLSPPRGGADGPSARMALGHHEPRCCGGDAHAGRAARLHVRVRRGVWRLMTGESWAVVSSVERRLTLQPAAAAGSRPTSQVFYAAHENRFRFHVALALAVVTDLVPLSTWRHQGPVLLCMYIQKATQ